MTLQLLAVYFALAVTLARSVLVKLQVTPPSCAGCGKPYERRKLGETVCSCSR